MTKVNVAADCGNSPKNIFLKDFNIALGKRDIDYIVAMVSDDIEWVIIGGKSIHGKDNFIDALRQMQAEQATEITVNTAISHGKIGSVSGEIKFKNGTYFAYCDVYKFTNAKGSGIKSIKSYVIEIS